MYIVDMDQRVIQKIGSKKQWAIEPFNDNDRYIDDEEWAYLDVQSVPVTRTLFKHREDEFSWLYEDKSRDFDDCLIPIYQRNYCCPRRALLVPIGMKSKIREGALEMAFVSGINGHADSGPSLTSVMFDDETREFVVPFCHHVDFDDEWCNDVRMLRIRIGLDECH